MHATAQEIASRQSERLATLLRAAHHTAFYGRVLSGLDPAHTALTALPVTSKKALMRQFASRVTDPALTLPDLRAFCADPRRIGERHLGRYWVWESSGSTGEPAVFVQDEAAMAVYDMLEATRRHSPRPWVRLFDPLCLGERFAFVGAIGGHFASHVSLLRLRQSSPWLARCSRSFSILQAADDLVAQLNAFAPSVLATYPTAALMLAGEARRGALRIRLGEVWTGGETLTPAMRASIEEAFGCHLRNSYGASEFLPIAFECGQGRLHVNADWVILEPVDARHRPLPAGQVSHTTLLTNLANHVQPLIRFDIGDRTRLGAERCPCGSALPVVEVQGRRDDALVVPGRDGRAVTLLPLALTTVLEDEAGVFDFQLQQLPAGTLRLTLGPAVPRTRAARERCRHALAEFAARQGAAPLRIALRAAATLPMGRSGKRKRIEAAPRPALDAAQGRAGDGARKAAEWP